MASGYAYSLPGRCSRRRKRNWEFCITTLIVGVTWFLQPDLEMVSEYLDLKVVAHPKKKFV